MSIIDDILDISEMESDRMKMQRAACSAAQIVTDVFTFMNAEATKKGISFNVEFPGPIPKQVHTDPARFRQIILNLVRNALKFTDTGSVRVVTRFEPIAAQLVVEVQDTGVGMTPEQMSRLFQAFSQADGSTTRRFGGNGLGLAISHRLAALLGGTLTGKSQIAVGSIFTLTLPVNQQDSAALFEPALKLDLAPAAEPCRQTAPKLAGTILLVEDGVDNQRLLSTHLRRAGAQVVVAENGRIALEQFDRQAFYLILMDMQMPEMDGYQATRRLREMGCRLPILALTAHAMAEDREKCLKAGCDEFLTKPIDQQKLIRVCAEFLAKVPQRRTEMTNSTQPHRSSYAEDQDMHELIDAFVGELPTHVREIRKQLDAGEMEPLRRVIHQLKGAGGGYGFDQITQLARVAEDAIKTGLELQAITGQVQSLVEYIRQVQGYEVARET
jgi:CheY-like chemotaxis protein